LLKGSGSIKTDNSYNYRYIVKMALPLLVLTASAACVVGLVIGSTYPESVSAGYKTIASKTWSTVRETTSSIYATVMETMPKSQGKAD
jgi:hypothetical protein